jgi:hypothetical protein
MARGPIQRTPGTQFLFYTPDDSSSNSAGNSNMPRRPGRPKGSMNIATSSDDADKCPVGRPRGTGPKQKAQKEAERKRCENPPPNAPVGLVSFPLISIGAFIF